MAIMIPSVISPDVKSNAEKHIFKWFQKAPGTEDWIILHSLGVSNHKKVIHGEVDFFALIPEMGIFALEVKGGRVRRQNGIWSFTDKYGHTDTKERGPFDQAWEGIYSLKESISKMLDNKHRGLKDVIFGIGVMFPDVEYSSIGVDAESWQIFDSSDGENVVAFISRISEGTKNTWKRTRGKIDKRNIPNVDDIKYLADLLRGDFDLVPLLGTKMTFADEDLCALTREQYKCLDQLEDNPRCLVRGAAGTGKTMLAIEATKNAVANGEKVALFCFNRLLGEWLQNYFVQQPINLRPVYVGTLHGFMRNILVAHGKNISVSDDLEEDEKQRYYSEVLPQMAIDCLYSDTAKFDRIIVDEAQDIISESYLNFLGPCIKRGTERRIIIMSRTRRNFSAKFKSELVIELLKGEKDLNTIATENNIQPNLLRNWKKEFLDKASVVFDDTREDNLKEKLALERKEKTEYAKKVGQLTMQVDWLKKKSEETLGPDYESKFSPKPFED